MQDAVLRHLIARNGELSDNSAIHAWKRRDMTFPRNLLQIRRDDDAMAAARDIYLIQMRRQARIRRQDVRQPRQEQ